MKKDQKSKLKRFILILVGIPLVLIIGFILFCCGIILWERFFVIPAEPKIKHGEFPFELVYKYNGVEYTLNDKIVCDYEGIDYAFDGGNYRDWSCKYETNKDEGYYYIDKENNPHLYIYVPLDERYYMGDEDAIDPGMPYIDFDYLPNEEEMKDNVDFEIIEWKPSAPIENKFE